MSETDSCEFYAAWRGPCDRKSVKDGFCEWHMTEKCGVCGKKAYGECGFAGQLVCGKPLCRHCQCPRHNELAITQPQKQDTLKSLVEYLGDNDDK